VYTGYWWIEYGNKETRIYFDGDIGGHFYIYVHIDNEKFGLWQFDRSVNNYSKSTKKNIIYQLEVLIKFFN
jgi:hypothetical protein